MLSCESSGARSARKDKEKDMLKGRRIIDVAMWFKQIVMLEKHSVLGCKFSDFEVISERFEGLRSGFAVKCKKCNCQSVVWTDDPALARECKDINSDAVAGIIAIGAGHTELEVLCENLKMQCMTGQLFSKRKSRLVDASSGSNILTKESASLNGRQLGQGSAVHSASKGQIPPVIERSSRFHLRNESMIPDSNVPAVAEPVQVFVDVPTAPIVSPDSAHEEVDPFMDVEKPLDPPWEKRVHAREMDQEGQDGLSLEGCNNQLGEVVAFSLQSDIVISNEGGDEKPALGSKVFCCSVDNCHGIFDSLGDLNQHQSLHHSLIRSHQPESVGAWHKGEEGFEEKESEMVLPNVSGIGVVRSGSVGFDVLPKSSKGEASEVGTMGDQGTATLSDEKITVKVDEGSNHSLDSKAVVLSSSVSGGHAVSRFGVKEECADEDEDIICVESKVLCKHCPVTFNDDASLKKHVSEAHMVGGGLSIELASRAPGKVPVEAGFQGKISLARDLFEKCSSLASVWHPSVEVTSQVNKDGLRIATTDCINSVPGERGNNPGQSSLPFHPSMFPRNLDGEAEADHGLVLKCDVCNKLYEVSESVMHEVTSKGGARVCLMCENKAKQQNCLNAQGKNPRRYQCVVCGQAYAMRCTLKRHERVHTGERPFVCGVCGRTYTRKEYLKDHMKNHTIHEGTS
ncbi:uncharacterized protein LOC124162173 [Ischnura elegans]|uniref:uncharacterized protein LOC124162173 n=1 Tax=Ischnura elegans TaxID=197161 RepID=UPI001ED89975|nr:uncharacterized protein LOC124162173 [Ischnura elegans]XP_046394556.1 uncharacterized protein LOC124162173 [Ischnura elegans]XP_046394557.1 uncharacterized protein LOC124162173 [Ischnura elegans]